MCRSNVNTAQSFNLSAWCHCFCPGLELSLWPTCHLASDFMYPGHGLLAPSPFSPAWMLTQHRFLSLPGWLGGGRPLTSWRAPCSAHQQRWQLDTPGVLLLPAQLKESEAWAGHIVSGACSYYSRYFQGLSTVNRTLWAWGLGLLPLKLQSLENSRRLICHAWRWKGI